MKKILIVDNNEVFIRKLRENFAPNGFSIIEAKNGWDGLVFANEFNPELIISNTDLPYLSGIEFFNQIKKYPVINKIPFLLVTHEVDTGFKFICPHDSTSINSKAYSFDGLNNYIQNSLNWHIN